MIAAEAEAAGGAISAKFSSAAPSSIFLERNAPGGGEFRFQVVSRETSQQILSLFGVRGCSKWKYDVIENGGQPSSLHMFCSLVHVCFYCILISVVATGGWTVIQSCSSGMKGHAALSEK